MLKNIWDKIWRDDSGKVVIWQWPNIWLLAWGGFTFVSLVFGRGTLANILTWAGEASLIIWSVLEIFKGVNYFRKTLGLVVLAYAMMSILRSF